jgi:hypothetical protein
MRYEMQVNEFSVDIVEYPSDTIFHGRVILTRRIDFQEEPKEDVEQQMDDLKLITAALNSYAFNAIPSPNDNRELIV